MDTPRSTVGMVEGSSSALMAVFETVGVLDTGAVAARGGVCGRVSEKWIEIDASEDGDIFSKNSTYQMHWSC